MLDTACRSCTPAAGGRGIDDPRFVEESAQRVQAPLVTFSHRRRHQQRVRQPGLHPVKVSDGQRVGPAARLRDHHRQRLAQHVRGPDRSKIQSPRCLAQREQLFGEQLLAGPRQARPGVLAGQQLDVAAHVPAEHDEGQERPALRITTQVR